MSKRSSKKADVAEKAPQPTLGDRLRAMLFQPKALLLLAVAVSSTFLIPAIRSQLPDLSARDEYQLPALRMEVTELPHWVPRDFVQQVVDRGGLPKQLSILDDSLTEEVAEAFALHPWVEEVVEVRKSIPARIQVELIYRKPVAMVAVKQGVYPIDGAGTLLPPADFSVTDTQSYPVIENVSSTPQGPAGTSWGDPLVISAASLAKTIEPYWKTFELAAIRVPDRQSATVATKKLEFELRTAGGSTIIWGRAPGSDHPGELTEEQKIGRLQQYLADFGSFDKPHGPYEIDIRHWREISRRPMTLNEARIRR